MRERMMMMWLMGVVIGLTLRCLVSGHTSSQTTPEDPRHVTPDPPLTDRSWDVIIDNISGKEADDSGESVHKTNDSQEDPTDKRVSSGGNTHDRAGPLNYNREMNFFKALIKDFDVRLLANPKTGHESKQSIPDDVVISQEEKHMAYSDVKFDFHRGYPESDNVTDNSTCNDKTCVGNGKQSENLTLSPFDKETNTESELVELSSSSSEEIGTTDSPTSTGGQPWLPWGDTAPELRLPLCCLDGQNEHSCLTQMNHSFGFYIPVAFGWCRAPKPHLFREYLAKYIVCPFQEIKKIAITPTRKMLYTDKLYFSWDQVLITDFCVEIDNENNSDTWAVFCYIRRPTTVTEHCTGVSCLKKCCPEGYVLQNRSCVCSEKPSFLSSNLSMILEDVGWPSVDEHMYKEIQVGFPNCQSSNDITTYSFSGTQRNIHFLTNGTLVVEHHSPFLDYCVDEFLGERNSGSLEETGTMVVVCAPSHDHQSTWTLVRSVLIPAGLMVSCVFLAATLLCHLCVAPLRDLHGLCLAAYVAALLVADATLFVTQAFSKLLPPSACISVAIILHVAFLSTFFWLNVICYDVWKYVGLTMQAVPLYRSPDDFGRFFAYAVYAWGSPLIIGGVAVIIHSLPQHIDWLLKPDFVQNRCWFRDGKEILAYFYGPMGVLCLANTLLICHTGLRLYYADKKCNCLFGSCSRADHTLYRTYVTEFRQRFTLFALMVICWVMEVISWMVGPADSELWALTDTLNTFQGVFIFITFLRSSKKRRLLQEILTRWSSAADRAAHLPQPHLPANRFNPMGDRLRNSTLCTTIVRWFHTISCRKRHLTSQQVLDNIIFKRRMEGPQGFKNEAYEDDATYVEGDVKRNAYSDEPVHKSLYPIWTVPQWKSHWSKTYFPNVLNTNYQNGNHQQKDKFACEDYKDFINLCSTFDQGLILPYTPLEARPSFTNWSILRHKAGSLTLAAGECGQSASKVVCQGLTKKDSQ